MPEGTLAAGLRLAATTFTVAPLRPGRVDRPAARVAVTVAPIVGAVLGVVLGGALAGLAAVPAPPLVAGTAIAGLAALLTRGLHLDGLADTADALGAYRSPDRALAVMRQPDVGPFGVVALVVVLLAQAASYAAIAGRSPGSVLAAVVGTAAAGRLAIAWACRRGVPAARPDGLGAMVAGAVGVPEVVAGTLAVLAVAVPAVPGRAWQGPVAVAAGLGTAWLLVRHAVRRFGGITGDVLGAACEVAATVALVLVTLG